MGAPTALSAKTGNDLDDQVDLVGKEGIEINEFAGAEFRKSDVGADAGMFGHAGAVRLEKSPQVGLSCRVLRKHTLASDFSNIGGFQVNLKLWREPVH